MSSQEEFERELIYRVGRILEKIGIFLISDDYQDYSDPQNAHPGLHHWMYGEILSGVGKSVQEESKK